MKVTVDEDKCIGCGLCVSLAEEVFKINKMGKSEVVGECKEQEREKVQEAIDACPVGAISWKEGENE